MTEKAKIWFYFLSSVLTPTKHVCIVRLDKAILLYAILNGYKIIFGKIIEKSILDYKRNNFFGHIPHPSIITYLSIKEGVTFDQEEEKKCPTISPLTLTAIIKALENKGKEKLKGVEEEGREKETELDNSEPSDQALVVSKEKIRNVRQGSASPDWVMYLEVEAYQREQAMSSRKHNSNLELLKMLKRLEQGKLERDLQLKAQLEKRDRYFDAKIRKKKIVYG